MKLSASILLLAVSTTFVSAAPPAASIQLETPVNPASSLVRRDMGIIEEHPCFNETEEKCHDLFNKAQKGNDDACKVLEQAKNVLQTRAPRGKNHKKGEDNEAKKLQEKVDRCLLFGIETGCLLELMENLE
jgi:hypothetical protein